MNKVLCLVFLMLLSVVSAFSQVLSLDLSKPSKHYKQSRHYFKLPEKSNTFRVDVGANYQFFDNPLFKCSSTKNATLAKFTSAAFEDFGLEYISPIPVVGHFTLMGGLYLSGVEFNYRYLQTEDFGLAFHALGEWVFQVSGGIGLNRSYHLRNRWYMDISSIAVISKLWIPASSAYVIIDTLGNKFTRKEAMRDTWHSMETLYPSQTPHPLSFRLKNKLLLSYYLSKTIGLHLSCVYNIGIPNKMFIYQFDYYQPGNRTTPDSHEKVVVSNSSFAWDIGFTLNLWDK